MNKQLVLRAFGWMLTGSYIAAMLGAVTANDGRWGWIWFVNILYAFIAICVYKNWDDITGD